MIALTRVRTAAAVPDDFYGAKRIAHNTALLRQKIAGAFDGKKPTSTLWKEAIWNAAKDQLLAESYGKCAYCESPTSVVAYGDVEHFRPKSKYWWLAYCYENYLPACTVCNQRYKRDDFAVGPKGKPWTGPVTKKGMKAAEITALAKTMTVDALKESDGMPMQQLIDAMNGEAPLLLHPYFQRPEAFLGYKAVLDTKEVIVVPLKPSAKSVVAACDQFFGINRKELRDERYRHYCTYMTYRQTLAVPSLPAKLKGSIQRRIEEMKGGTLRYTGMIRYFDQQKLEDLPWDFEV